MTFVVATHGGAASRWADRDGCETAAQRAVETMRKGGSPLDAAVEATALLEDDPRFNAGTGSNLRLDGRTIEMDASCMDGAGRFGAVAVLRRVKNPILVAKALLPTPHNLLAGEGALRYARALGHPDYDPTTPQAQARFDRLCSLLRAKGHAADDCSWDLAELASHWNYEISYKELLGPSDTVGAVATDGVRYAVASSTGGTMATLLGRVGDVPLPGCGIHAGPAAAVAVTGDGDYLARAFLASRLYYALEEGTDPEAAVQKAIGSFPPHVDVGVILVRGAQSYAASNRDMAFAIVREDDP